MPICILYESPFPNQRKMMVFRAELILMDFIKMTEIQTIGRKVVTCPKLHTHSV